jgi:hypothetical protein
MQALEWYNLWPGNLVSCSVIVGYCNSIPHNCVLCWLVSYWTTLCSYGDYVTLNYMHEVKSVRKENFSFLQKWCWQLSESYGAFERRSCRRLYCNRFDMIIWFVGAVRVCEGRDILQEMTVRTLQLGSTKRLGDSGDNGDMMLMCVVSAVCPATCCAHAVSYLPHWVSLCDKNLKHLSTLLTS